ncbi:MAG: aromatic ring-hydroxylating dioxygenase subunit alpha [Burkholderiales bacterium]|nr:aromatic ring-hydroxylating dioxygenase subunit alpha [Burkholderiales bacterium]
MLNEERNRTLTQVGRGTPMGELLRRHWMPVAGVAEFDDTPIRALRLMGEDLVLYKDLGGKFGLIDRRCAHRRADLLHGYVEPDGLRCSYHGWNYDATGRCIGQPYEDIAHPELNAKDSVRITAYPVEIKAGLVWAYLGPAPAPLVPDWEPFSWGNGFAQVVISEVPCNWLQCQENSIDPVHFEWTHSNWKTRLAGRTGPYAPTHLKVGFEEFEFGLVYKRIREDTSEKDPLWVIGRTCLWPNAFFLGDHFEWRVPIDDENTLSVTWSFMRVPRESEPYVQERIPAWRGPTVDADGRWITSHVMNQDFVAWSGQGRIADRTQEHLAPSDAGIVMLRKRLFDDLKALEEGRDPRGILRDPAKNLAVRLPVAARRALTEGMTRAELLAHPQFKGMLADYVFQAGQPRAVRAEFERAMGLIPGTGQFAS